MCGLVGADAHCNRLQVGPAATTKDCWSCGGGGWNSGWGNSWGGGSWGNNGWDQSYQQPSQNTNINNKCATQSEGGTQVCGLFRAGHTGRV